MIPAPKLNTLQKIWTLLTPAEHQSAMGLVVLIVIGMLLETLSVGLVIPALAVITQYDYITTLDPLQPLLELFGYPAQQTLVIAGMVVLVGIYLFKIIFLAFLAWRQSRFTFRLQAHLSQRLFALYLKQPYTFHLQRNSAKLMRNVLGEVTIFANNAATPVMILITECLVLAGLCTLLIVVEPIGAIIVFCVIGMAGYAFHSITGKHVTYWAKARQFHDGLRIQHLQQGLGGAKDMKLLGREAEFIDQFSLHTTQSARMGQFQHTLQQFPRLWLELLAVVGLSTLVISMVLQDRSLESILPTLGVFTAAAFRLMPSVNRILTSLQSLRYSLPVLDNLQSELSLLVPAPSAAQGNKLTFKNRLELTDITYTYPGAARPALRNVSLSIQQGEAVGIIGESGAGKSTLVDIFLGLLTPHTGQIYIDDRNIQENLRSWQDQIGYVPQSIYLTDDTLRRNVAFGLPENQINDNAVWEAIRAAQLEEFVKGLPDGLNTVVGERGVRISGGQRQRIGIARALYHDPQVLVLDEATSSLDTDTERGVMDAVSALHGKKTILIVAHRLSTVERCNRIYELEEGKVIAQGSASDMLQTKKVI